MNPNAKPSPLRPFDPAGARLVLGIAVAATLAGSLVTALRAGGSGWNAWLFLDLGCSHATAFRIETGLAAVSLAGALAALALPGQRLGGLLMLPAFAFLLSEACLIARMGGVGHAEWAPAAHALRYGTPLAIALLALGPAFGEGRIEVLLRLCLAFAFFTHGAEALLHYARFIDLIIGSAENLAGWRITESQAKTLLTLIGSMDVGIALLVLLRPSPAVLWWMAAWGLITALSRVTSLGWDAYREVLLRTTHFLVPFALVWFRRR